MKNKLIALAVAAVLAGPVLAGPVLAEPDRIVYTPESYAGEPAVFFYEKGKGIIREPLGEGERNCPKGEILCCGDSK